MPPVGSGGRTQAELGFWRNPVEEVIPVMVKTLFRRRPGTDGKGFKALAVQLDVILNHLSVIGFQL